MSGDPTGGRELSLPSTVTVVSMDGRRRVGTLSKFAPTLPDIVIEEPPKDGDRARNAMLRAEALAYIGFHRGNDASQQLETGLERYKLSVVGGEQLSVLAMPSAISHPLGFFAYPVGKDSPFRSLYVYRHGVLSRE